MTTFMAYKSETGKKIEYKHKGDAGLDLRSSIDTVILPGSRVTVPTGIYIELPPGHVGYVMPRSGLARDYGITVLNAPGIIDQGYRGEIMVTLYNSGSAPFEIQKGYRIAQLVVALFTTVKPVLVEKLSYSERGNNGFGSSGIK